MAVNFSGGRQFTQRLLAADLHTTLARYSAGVRLGKEDAVDLISFIGLVAIGAALAAPLVYGLATLLGMKHRQFHPILRHQEQDGTTVQMANGQAEPPGEPRSVSTQQGRT